MTLQDLRIVADDEDDEKDKDKAESAKKEETNRAVQKILFDSRTILLFGEINEKTARETISQLLAMGEESREPIRMVISSPGGHSLTKLRFGFLLNIGLSPRKQL